MEKDWPIGSKSQLEGISVSVLLHSRVTIINNNVLYIPKDLGEGFKCSYHKEMIIV
jgi:hypothetical protein